MTYIIQTKNVGVVYYDLIALRISFILIYYDLIYTKYLNGVINYDINYTNESVIGLYIMIYFHHLTLLCDLL